MRVGIGIAALCATCGPGLAQGYEVVGTVFERGTSPPSFGPPTVEIAVVEDIGAVRDSLGDLGDLTFVLVPDLEEEGFVFSKYLGDWRLGGRTVVFSAQSGGWVLPGLRTVQLRNELAGERDIEVLLPLERRSVLAEAYRKEVFEVYRQDNLAAADYLRAVTAAQRAVEDDPRLDNYLLAIRTSRAALFEGGLEHPTLLTSISDLRAMPGFAALDFAGRWRVQSDLLDMLASAPAPEAPAFFGQSYREASIAVAEQMIAQLSADTPDLRALPATRVFNTLTQMHSDNGDCPSLVQASTRATDLAEPLNMNWASQRRFLLDWGDCLERLSGIGNGRSAEAFVEQTRANARLRALWADFSQATRRNDLNFLFPSNATDERLRALAERGWRITEGD